MRTHHLFNLPALLLLLLSLCNPSRGDERSIAVINAKHVGVDRIPCQRVALGEPDDYKACAVRLPDDSLRVVAFHQFRRDGDKLVPYKPGEKGLLEQMILYRSDDGGRTWSAGERPSLIGREPYFSITRDGTLFITTHLLQDDVRNTLGVTHSYLHRSTDGGKTWYTTRIAAADIPGAPANQWVITSRNVLELADGTLVLGASSINGLDYLWRSRDKGKTWDRSLACTFVDLGVDKSKIWWPFWAETVLWQARNGDLLGLWRVDHKVIPIPGTEAPPAREDSYERMMVFRSKDGGAHWAHEPELGSDYAEYYPSILRLQDERLLLTFTVRARVKQQQLGIHAVLGVERDDGFKFDFTTDRMIVDDRTPMNQDQGGGFGPTVQLNDGTLVTAYSYRGADGKTRLEATRWKLPPSR